MNMETSRVERHQGEFFVTSIEDLQDVYIKVSANRVEQIVRRIPDVDEMEVAILLATITEVRVIPEWRLNGYRKVDDIVADRAIIRLLQENNIETLNDIFEELKYFEIRDVLESDNPVAALRAIS